MQNKIPAATFNVITGNLVDNVTERFDLVAANITSKAILMLLDNIKKKMVKKSIFICSGIIEEQKIPVLKKMEQLSFNVIKILTQENWVSIVCKLH